MNPRFLFTFIFLLFSFFLHADLAKSFLQGTLVEGITVDLREPCYSDGVLSTTEGGVVRGPNIRIQAQKMTYIRKVENGFPICKIVAEKNLMLEMGDYIFVGRKLEYDFQSRTGILYCARTGIDHWYIGGNNIQFYPDDSYAIQEGYITTSETLTTDWKATAQEATLINRRLKAQSVKFQLYQVPVFWLPSFDFDLNSLDDSPFSYDVGWGGSQGTRVGIEYKVFSWDRWKTYARLDYRFRKRGIGGGIETYYSSPDHKATFQTINYVAQDHSIFIPKESVRYLFQGAYHNQFLDDKVTVDLTYYKLSDQYMGSDYEDQGLELENPIRTELDIRRQEKNWIANFLTCVRINSFETLKQELPTLQTSWRPFQIGSTGIISDNRMRLSYLDFVYANHECHVRDYHSSRLIFMHNLYRPFPWGHVTFTPEAGTTAIFYGDSPEGPSRWVLVGNVGGTLVAPLYRYYGDCKHTLIPYLRYRYDAFPTTVPNHHYIFDICDGWYRLSRLRFGLHQSLYSKECGFMRRNIDADVYADAFFDSKNIPAPIPRAYANLIYNSSLTLRHCVGSAWNFFKNRVDYFNFRTEWTYSPDFAVALEFRHRDAYYWRKADRDNFMLDAFRPVKELLHSSVSDRRNTALVHFFYRFHPNWAVEYEARHGWLRRNHTRYTEFEVNLLGHLRSASRIKISYQHTEGEDRIAVYFSIGLDRPDRLRSQDFVPLLEF